ncbi:MAG: HlyD family efflux transporter periplasmic adaptor subunit, partial [Cyanobacteria bacterium J06607_10]
MNSQSHAATLLPSIKQRLRKLSPRWLIGLGLFGVLFVALPIVRSRSVPAADAELAQSDSILPVETVTAEKVGSYRVSRAYTGEVSALQASELGFERSGQLTALLVPEGSPVGAGEPMAQLDVRNLNAQRLQIEAEKSRAIAQLTELEVGARTEDIAAAQAVVEDLEQQIALQRTQLARREILYERGAISQEALDEFSFGEGSLAAQLSRARSQLNELQNGTRPEQISAQNALVQQLDARLADLDVNLAKSTLIAPFSGTVAEHKVDTGTVVGAGQSVIRLVENTAPEARVGVPADDIRRLNIGEERTVSINGEKFTGTITSILPEVNAQTRTQTVVLALENRAASRVSPGQTVRLELTERIASEGIWLPSEALTQGIRGLWTAYTVVPESSAASNESASNEAASDLSYVVQTKAVEIVHQEGDRVLVTGTLQPEDV